MKFRLSHLGGVVGSVLATGRKGRGFKTGWGDGFLREIYEVLPKSSGNLTSAREPVVVRRFDTIEEIQAESQEVLNTHLRTSRDAWNHGKNAGIAAYMPKGLLRRRRWKLGVRIINFFMVKFRELLGSTS
jgi:hypothetical protein